MPTTAQGIGYRPTETSHEAAISMEPTANTLRQAVISILSSHPEGMTADEIANALNVSVLAIRPRCTEHKKAGRIVPTGEKRQNESGRRADVYKLNEVEMQQEYNVDWAMSQGWGHVVHIMNELAAGNRLKTDMIEDLARQVSELKARQPEDKKKPRSLPEHNRFFASIDKLHKHLPERFADEFPTARRLRKFLLYKCGFKKMDGDEIDLRALLQGDQNDIALKTSRMIYKARRGASEEIFRDESKFPVITYWRADSQGFADQDADEFREAKKMIENKAYELFQIHLEDLMEGPIEEQMV